MKTLSVPHPTHPVEFDTALRTLAAQACERYPDEKARIDRGLVLALNGHVTLHTDGTATVQSGTDREVQYQVGHGICDCPDAGRAPHCKHAWARCLVRKAHKLVPPPPAVRVAYHATFKGVHGQAIRDEQGRVWFQGDNERMLTLTDADRPNLQLHGRVDLCADARRRDLEAGTDLSRLDALTMERTILDA
jgi:hypothetical protein